MGYSLPCKHFAKERAEDQVEFGFFIAGLVLVGMFSLFVWFH